MAFGFWKSGPPARPVRSATAQRAGSAADRSNRFHAVSVQCGPACAATSLTLEGRRFLSAEAPVLPQPTCSPANCQCRYVHHDDRRAGFDRREYDVWNSMLTPERVVERRRNRGRRTSDYPELA